MTRRDAVLLVVVACLSASVAVGQETPAPTREKVKDVQREYVAPPGTAEAQIEELQSLIQQIESMEVPHSRKPQKPDKIYVPEPKSAKEPAGKPTEEPTSQPAQEPQANPKTSKPGISPEALEELRRLSPEEIADPIRLADALFASGHYAEAHLFYQRSMAGVNDETLLAWLVYQSANCLFYNKPAEARALYMQLITDHPESTWAPVAQEQTKLLDWFLNSQPYALVEDLQAQAKRFAAEREKQEAQAVPVLPTGRED